MLAVTFVVSFLSVCGFYAYVFVRMESERRKLDAHKKHLPEHLYEMEPEPEEKAPEDRGECGLGASPGRGRTADGGSSMRGETLVQVSLAVGGLAALFAGIEILNSLVNRLRWN